MKDYFHQISFEFHKRDREKNSYDEKYPARALKNSLKNVTKVKEEVIDRWMKENFE
jgi:hypothetical protein